MFICIWHEYVKNLKFVLQEYLLFELFESVGVRYFLSALLQWSQFCPHWNGNCRWTFYLRERCKKSKYIPNMMQEFSQNKHISAKLCVRVETWNCQREFVFHRSQEEQQVKIVIVYKAHNGEFTNYLYFQRFPFAY